MKNPNGYGSVYKLSGNRRKPYVARVTVKTEYDEEKDNYLLKRKIIGYYRTQAEAIKALAMFNDNPCDPEKIDITFDEIWQQIEPELKTKLSAKRYGCYKAAYNYCEPIKDKRVKDLRKTHLQKIIDDCDKKSSTKSDIKIVMKKIFQYAIENSYVTIDYTQNVTFKKDAVEMKREVFTPEQIDLLWKTSNEWPSAMMLILLYSGMRINEFISSKAENINIEEKTITLPRDIVKNDSSARIVPIHDKVLPLFEAFKAVGSEWIAVKPNGVHIQYKNFMDRDLRKLNEYLGSSHTPHDARHTFITSARECGMDLLVIQRIVGHTPETITEERYTHLKINELITEINKLKY